MSQRCKNRDCEQSKEENINSTENFCPDCDTPLTRTGEKIKELQGSLVNIMDDNRFLKNALAELSRKLDDMKSPIKEPDTPNNTEKQNHESLPVDTTPKNDKKNLWWIIALSILAAIAGVILAFIF